MKKTILYLSSLILFLILFFLFKQSINKNIETDIELRNESFIYAEVEVLNGCGESGVANLYTNFLRKNDFDVIEIKNADNFNFTNTLLLVSNSNNNKVANKLAELLTIKEENIRIDKNIVWDFSIIIGKDYKNLKSFEQIQKFYSLF